MSVRQRVESHHQVLSRNRNAPDFSFLRLLLLPGPGRWDAAAAKLSALFVTILESASGKNITAQWYDNDNFIKTETAGKKRVITRKLHQRR